MSFASIVQTYRGCALLSHKSVLKGIVKGIICVIQAARYYVQFPGIILLKETVLILEFLQVKVLDILAEWPTFTLCCLPFFYIFAEQAVDS